MTEAELGSAKSEARAFMPEWFTGFHAAGGAIKVLMPNELADVVGEYEIQGRKNGFFEAAPMLFPRS